MGTDICIYMHNTHAHSLKLSLAATLPLSVMHTHTQTHIHRLTQPWNPLRLGDLAKQLIHSAFDLFPISSLQSANWEKQKRRGDCCMSPRDQTKERPRDSQKMLVCVDGCWDVRLCIQLSTGKKLCEWLTSPVVEISSSKLCLILQKYTYETHIPTMKNVLMRLTVWRKWKTVLKASWLSFTSIRSNVVEGGDSLKTDQSKHHIKAATTGRTESDNERKWLKHSFAL